MQRFQDNMRMGGCENLVLCSWVLASHKKLTRLDTLLIRDPICRFDVIWQRGEQLKSKLRMQHISLSPLLSMDGEDQSNDSVCFPSSLLFEEKWKRWCKRAMGKHFWSRFFHSTDKESKRDSLPHSHHNNVWSRSEKAELFVWVFNFMILYHNALVVLGRRKDYIGMVCCFLPPFESFLYISRLEWMNDITVTTDSTSTRHEREFSLLHTCRCCGWVVW